MSGEGAHAAWLVDLDGTLYAPTPVQLAMGAEVALLGWGSLAILRRFRQELEEVRALDLEGDPFMLQVARTAEALGASPASVEAAARHWMLERPSKWITMFRRRSLLKEIYDFRATGGRTALVSDYPARRKLEALGASKLFDIVVAPGEPDGPLRLKPHPAGVLRAAAALGVDPGRCHMLGDRLDTDGAVAPNAGLAFRLVR